MSSQALPVQSQPVLSWRTFELPRSDAPWKSYVVPVALRAIVGLIPIVAGRAASPEILDLAISKWPWKRLIVVTLAYSIIKTIVGSIWRYIIVVKLAQPKADLRSIAVELELKTQFDGLDAIAIFHRTNLSVLKKTKEVMDVCTSSIRMNIFDAFQECADKMKEQRRTWVAIDDIDVAVIKVVKSIGLEKFESNKALNAYLKDLVDRRFSPSHISIKALDVHPLKLKRSAPQSSSTVSAITDLNFHRKTAYERCDFSPVAREALAGTFMEA